MWDTLTPGRRETDALRGRRGFAQREPSSARRSGKKATGPLYSQGHKGYLDRGMGAKTFGRKTGIAGDPARMAAR
jgi:hypothetical protein